MVYCVDHGREHTCWSDRRMNWVCTKDPGLKQGLELQCVLVIGPELRVEAVALALKLVKEDVK